MDKKTAWGKFVKTGDIDDYLEFCKCRKMEEKESGKESKS
jgi:hypothetical protein